MRDGRDSMCVRLMPFSCKKKDVGMRVSAVYVFMFTLIHACILYTEVLNLFERDV